MAVVNQDFEHHSKEKKVEESQTAATPEYQGTKYYFSVAGCERALDEEPEKYLAE